MNSNRQLAPKGCPMFPRWLLPCGVALMMLSGCDAETGDKGDVGPGISRPDAAIAADADGGGLMIDETAVIPVPSTIEFDDGKLSVSLDAMPLPQVMAEVSRQSGIEIQFMGEPPDITLNMQFSDSRLEQGLRRLLTDINALFVYADSETGANSDRQLARVLILPRGEHGQIDSGSTDIVNRLSGISEQILNSIPQPDPGANAQSSINDTFTDQTLYELTETLRERLSGPINSQKQIQGDQAFDFRQKLTRPGLLLNGRQNGVGQIGVESYNSQR